jgi:hypothetical protein
VFDGLRRTPADSDIDLLIVLPGATGSLTMCDEAGASDILTQG